MTPKLEGTFRRTGSKEGGGGDLPDSRLGKRRKRGDGKDSFPYAPWLELFSVLSPFCANSSYSRMTPCSHLLVSDVNYWVHLNAASASSVALEISAELV